MQGNPASRMTIPQEGNFFKLGIKNWKKNSLGKGMLQSQDF